MDPHSAAADALRKLTTDRFTNRSSSQTDIPSPAYSADYLPSTPQREAEPLPPTTPSKGPANAPVTTTPTRPNLSSDLANRQSSGKVTMEERRGDLKTEISGKVVGPMKMEDFLNDFLPPSPSEREGEGDFTKVTVAQKEDEMPEAWIKAIERFCANFDIVDTQNTEFIDYNGQKLRPDVSFFRKYGRWKKDISILEMIAEFKLRDDSDPFSDKKGKPFERNAIGGTATLAQITDYSTSQLASQHRTHLFSLLVFKTYGRFLRWDRAGVIVSERVYFSDPHYSEFFWRFNHASPKDRGLDITVTRTLEIGKDIRGKLGLAEDAPLYQVTVTPQGPGYIIGTPMNLGAASPTGRSTRAYKAFSLETKTIVFLKDTWRVSIDHLKPEHEIYERLHKANVSNIPTVIEARDMDGQVTLTGEYAEKEWAKRISSMRVFQHYRLVLKEIGRELTSFNTTKELVTAIRDAVKAHREAFERAHVLHRDISTGNILITDSGGGLLIDWDLCKDLTIPSGVHSTERTGTWYFMASRLQDDPSLSAVPSFEDDLESFMLVMTYMILHFTYHELDGASLKNFINIVFKTAIAPTGDAGKHPINGFSKRNYIVTGFRQFPSFCFENSPLVPLLESIRQPLAVRYEDPPSVTDEEDLLKFYERKKSSNMTDEEELRGSLKFKRLFDYKDNMRLLEDKNWLEDKINKELIKKDT